MVMVFRGVVKGVVWIWVVVVVVVIPYLKLSLLRVELAASSRGFLSLERDPWSQLLPPKI